MVKRKAFTLAETLVALSIIIMFGSLITIGTRMMHQTQTQAVQTMTTQRVLRALIILESPDAAYRLVTCHADVVRLRSQTKQQDYLLLVKRQRLVVTTMHSGQIVLLNQVKQAKFQRLSDRRIGITIFCTTGQKVYEEVTLY